ncbi:FAD-binding protein [Ancylobacter terrae]|uniref:FAD-binding protein n=1 Tax=Ancylobacter sp. sgz301288 TaxID=3342077 RepID=UPI00385AA2B4
MTDRLCPRDEAEVSDAIRWAAAEGRTFELVGGGSKRALGRAVQTDATLDLSSLAGVELYEPEELVLSAKAATPLQQIGELVAAQGQMLAFEPMDYGPLLGEPPGGGTLGGLLACNLAGPRRLSAGAARDHALGIRAVSGRGEVFKAGGRVVKNVTGYDLPRGLAGSYGTLAAFTEITIKVLPRPETQETLLVLGLDDRTAARAMSTAVGSYYDVSSAAHLPAPVAALVTPTAAAGTAVTALRLEGVPASIRHRRSKLEALLAPFGSLEALGEVASQALWREIRDAVPFADRTDHAVWRVSTTPSDGAVIGEAARRCGGSCFYDWAGGLVWMAMPAAEPHADVVRAAVARTGGHATLVRATAAHRAALDVFQAPDTVTRALSGRLKASFDPAGVLNPGRMHAGM